MKALSIRQPWPWLITRPDLVDEAARAEARAIGAMKDIENRTWRTNFRGRILIHASKSMTRADYADARDSLEYLDLAEIPLPSFEQLQRGGIVGVATIDDCVPSSQRSSRWHIEGCFGFHLVDVKPLPLLPCKGELQIFDVPADVAATLRVMYGPRPTGRGRPGVI
ncbi:MULTISPECIES: ASCH domain-containing protein [unclassified Burkholderia]|uniref:ASCH domain-containing protein n=1 Tax=unclassified Burkholderia TaxID=2613784 RepID=UPI002AB19CED|nr:MULTISPECIES: ASCH domain-containing protein [unclassified Burkholderia]